MAVKAAYISDCIMTTGGAESGDAVLLANRDDCRHIDMHQEASRPGGGIIQRIFGELKAVAQAGAGESPR